MIQVEKLSFGFPAKELYEKISFTIEKGQKCGFIGSNGTGKSTLVEIITDDEKYLYDGKVIKDEDCRIGYAGQFALQDKEQKITVFDYLCLRFSEVQKRIEEICDKMAISEDLDIVYEEYQEALDLYESMDGDNHESNILKQLHNGNMTYAKDTSISDLSGGEYKLLQIMREMLLSPNLLILDEPDAFLDFGNLNKLSRLINGYDGTLLVITHNRYLLNHCFNKILHLEGGDIQEFEGNYTEYRSSQFREKLRLRLQNIEEQAEIERTEEMVQILRRRATILVNPVIGSAVNAKQSQLDRLRARQIRKPFIEVREPKIKFPEIGITTEGRYGAAESEDFAEERNLKTVLSVKDYSVGFGENLPENISFEIKEGEKVAVVGGNGTGKTTIVRDILSNANSAITIDKDTKYACLSQIHSDTVDENKTVYEVMEDFGFETKRETYCYLRDYCFEEETLNQKVYQLSGGEKNLLQIAIIAKSQAELLILDEPTSHLDLYGQMALEKSLAQYKGTVLMISHDFYLISNCVDYVLFVEGKNIKKMKVKNFRKMVYDRFFERKYLETDRKRQELETAIAYAFKDNRFITVEKLCDQLEELALTE